MKRVVFQLFALLMIFFVSWYAVAQVDWMTLLDVNMVAKKTEEKIGKMLYDVFRTSRDEVKDKIITQPVDSILSKICASNEIDRKEIRLVVLKSDEVNAFALPDNQLIVFTGLIESCEKPEELAGVIGHEVAHIQLRHVMKKLVKEIGLSALLSMTGGNAGGEVLGEAAKLLSGSAYDRSLEKAADLQAVKYLEDSDIDPRHFADFLSRLAQETPALPDGFAWISTHPDSEDRSKYVLEEASSSTDYPPVISAEAWSKMKDAVE